MKLKKRLSMVLVFAALMSTLGLCSPAYAMANAGDECMGQISLLAIKDTPENWVLCDGSTLNIQEYPALFALIGNTFGGDYPTTFKVPDLTNASPVSGAKYYMSIKGNYGFDSGSLIIGEVCLLPDMLVQKTETLVSSFLKCDGSTYSIPSYSSLYSIIGTTFGGNGVNSFSVPDLTKASPLEGLSYYIVHDGMYPTMGGSIPTDEFMGSIDLFPFTNRTFSNTAVCNGQTLVTANNQALSSLVGTTYGGDTNNFAIPDLRGAVPSPSFRYYLITGGIFPSKG
ncbi:MAG: tail fiber protein [Anaerotignaceae bacterium]